MEFSAPTTATTWEPLAVSRLPSFLKTVSVCWWMSGGCALDHWLGRSIRVRPNIDISVMTADIAALIAELPDGFSAWSCAEDDTFSRFEEMLSDADIGALWIYDHGNNSWVLQLHAEDGIASSWVYKRDPRLQLPWDRVIADIDGISTGLPEVQLVWKALRPRPEDDVDKEAVLPELSDAARSWWQKAILSIHPHSSWAIQVRSPLTPAKASWNRPSR